MRKYANNTNISLSMAVYYATDLYDHNDDPNHISVTELIRSPKQIILGKRVPKDSVIPDLTTRIKSQAGTAMHTAIEYAWEHKYKQAMQSLGYPNKIIDRVLINPSSEQLESKGPDSIPIYMERRSQKTVGGITISGKFDFVSEGRLEDFKRTAVFTYKNKSNDGQYILQGSLYKWLNQDIIIGDFIDIQYEFTDWLASMTRGKNYPPRPQMAYKLPLMSVTEIDNWVNTRVALLVSLGKADEEDMPDCTQSELWQQDSTFKYYKNPGKTTGRSTANFTDANEANIRLAIDGGVGIVKEFKGKAKACNYCKAFTICKQKDRYL